MHVVELVYTGMVFCFVFATIIGVVSGTSKPSPVGAPSAPVSFASR